MGDETKLFVGGLNWETTDDGLKKGFDRFGKVTEGALTLPLVLHTEPAARFTSGESETCDDLRVRAV